MKFVVFNLKCKSVEQIFHKARRGLWALIIPDHIRSPHHTERMIPYFVVVGNVTIENIFILLLQQHAW